MFAIKRIKLFLMSNKKYKSELAYQFLKLINVIVKRLIVH